MFPGWDRDSAPQCSGLTLGQGSLLVVLRGPMWCQDRMGLVTLGKRVPYPFTLCTTSAAQKSLS